MSDQPNRPKILIVGCGLVGTLNALFFSRYDRFDITICEKTSDIRLNDREIGKSINLSLSYRGLNALNIIGLKDEILKVSVPIYGRMVHEHKKGLTKFLYGKNNECIWSLDRKQLNDILLTNIENHKDIKIMFNYKLKDVSFSKRIAKFLNGKEFVEIKYDLLIGNDGAYSTVRQMMSRNMRLNFSQEYISHGYIEIHIPISKVDKSKMNINFLHLWPKNEFLLISLPNLDGSFSGTLFMPFSLFEEITTKECLFNFFQEHFPDALNIIGRTNLEKSFFKNRPYKMVTIRCNPYNLNDSCLIMGDAAHAMVPFYGQGMNCGFEDLVIFHDILSRNNFDIGKSCYDFTEIRNKDANAICELAFYNYIELRKHVVSISFRIRRMFDNVLNYIFPKFWIPLYTMVSFTNIPYSKCIEEKRKQDKILLFLRNITLLVTISGLLLGGLFFLARLAN